MDDLTGKILTSINGNKYLLKSIIGEGAEGVIYDVTNLENVIKLYKNESEIKNKKKLKKLNWLTKINYPSQFIKPLDLFESPFIGYAMKRVKNHISLSKLLIPNKNMSFSDWYNNSTGGLYRRLLVGQKIALQFANLHKMNMAYCDLSGNNILVNEDKSINSVCMIDIDNIYIPGADEVNVLGTSRYMAPEILKRQINPDIFTDSYSLAVLLFELLKAGHPYIGDFVEDGTPEQMTEAYKGLYPYVDDPENDMNRSSQMLPSDVVFTTELKELFQKTFIKGKENRLERVRAYDFSIALQRAANLVVKCDSCGCWHYARPNERHEYICPWCDTPYSRPLRIAFYEKYNCKINGQKVDLSEKHIEDYILKEKAVNIVTKNYINNSYIENDTDALGEYFSLRLGKDGNYYLINQLGNNVYIQKNRGNRFIKSLKNKPERIDKGDRLFFTNESPTELKESSLKNGGNVKGLVFRYAVIK